MFLFIYLNVNSHSFEFHFNISFKNKMRCYTFLLIIFIKTLINEQYIQVGCNNNNKKNYFTIANLSIVLKIRIRIIKKMKQNRKKLEFKVITSLIFYWYYSNNRYNSITYRTKNILKFTLIAFPKIVIVIVPYFCIFSFFLFFFLYKHMLFLSKNPNLREIFKNTDKKF